MMVRVLGGVKSKLMSVLSDLSPIVARFEFIFRLTLNTVQLQGIIHKSTKFV